MDQNFNSLLSKVRGTIESLAVAAEWGEWYIYLVDVDIETHVHKMFVYCTMISMCKAIEANSKAKEGIYSL